MHRSPNALHTAPQNLTYQRKRLITASTSAWAAIIQVVVVEEIAASTWHGYSRVTGYISELGTSASPLSWLMNTSIFLSGALLIVGTLGWLRLQQLDWMCAAGFVLTGVGLVCISLFPLDREPTIHALSANLAFAFGPMTAFATSLLLLRGDRSDWLAGLATVLGGLSVLGWIAHASMIVQILGVTQRWMVTCFMASIVALGFALRRRALQ